MRTSTAITGMLAALSVAQSPADALVGEPARSSTPISTQWRVPEQAAVDRLLSDRLRRNGVGLVVGIIEPTGSRIAAAGHLDSEATRPLPSDAIFQIGSVTKALTTLLLADMVERGEVRLDDPITDYLPPAVSPRFRGRPITLRDLATHVSGLPPMPTNFVLTARPDPYEAYTVDQLWSFLSSFEPEHAPGEVFRYSNLGVALLGRLLARRAGTDYETLLRQRILEPLGMRDSGVTLTPDQLRKVAPGHDRYLRPVRTWEMREMPASGSVRSTASDLLNLLEAYLGYRDTPLAGAMRRQLAERMPRDRGLQALGWGISGEGIVNHSGGKQGYRSAVAFDPTTRIGVVVLANARTYDSPMDLAMYLLTGRPLPPAPPAPATIPIVRVNSALLDRYSGRYLLPSGEILEVMTRDRHLLVHTLGEGISEFFPYAEDRFFLDTGNDRIAFECGHRRDPPTLVLYPDGPDGPAERAERLR